MTLLEVEDVHVRYGLAEALFGVSFGLAAGDCLAILGPNGAGKSSLARAISGTVTPSAGRITFDGETISGARPHRIKKLGIAYVPEGRGIFRTLSVTDNLKMFLHDGNSRRRCDQLVQDAFDMFPRLAGLAGQRAGQLSGGEQQMLALARVLVDPPRLLIADEPSLGLAPQLIDMVFDVLRKLRDAGTTIVLIEQYVHRALEYASECLVLERGTVKWAGPSADAITRAGDLYLSVK
jgi:ABC-type branched-subunit amino acid transport system ATPase component